MSKYYIAFKTNIYLLLGLLLVFIPLYPKFPFLNTVGTYVAIRLEDILILVCFILWSLVNLSNFKKFFKQTIFQLFLLFWIIGGLSLLSGIFITHSVVPHLGALHWLRRIEYMSLFLMAATSIASQKQAKILLKVLFATALAVVLYGFGQIWLDFPVISTTNKEFSKGLILFLTNGARVSSTFAGHYDLAIYLSIILMFIGNFFFYYKKLIAKIAILLIGGLSFILLGFTAARVSFVVTFIGLAIILWLDEPTRSLKAGVFSCRNNKKRILLGVLILAALLTIGLVPDLRHRLVATVTVNLMGGGGAKYTPPPGTVNRFTPKNQIPESAKTILTQQSLLESTQSPVPSQMPRDTAPGEPVNSTELGVYRSFGIRLNVEWPRAINAFLKNPFLGTGYSSITLATDNDILRSFGEVGILGTLAFGLIFYAILKKSWLVMNLKSGFEKNLANSITATIIVLILTGLFIDVFEASKVAEVFWLIAGMSWAILNLPKEEI